jgi:hypothetical protein
MMLKESTDCSSLMTDNVAIDVSYIRSGHTYRISLDKQNLSLTPELTDYEKKRGLR